MSRLDRKQSAIEIVRPRLLICTEGQNTEPRYFKALSGLGLDGRMAGFQIVSPGCTDPMGLLREAYKLHDHEKKNAKGSLSSGAFDQCWLVCDAEGPNNAARRQQIMEVQGALQEKKYKNFELAKSTPSFEYRLLLHFTYTTRGFASADEVSVALKKHLPTYNKATWSVENYRAMLTPDRLECAMQNAERVRQHNRQSGAMEPQTDVDMLVRALGLYPFPDRSTPRKTLRR